MQNMRYETRFTYDFIRQFLPRACKRILEVGCGTGELAARLLQDGFKVTAIDSDNDSIVAARLLGVDAHMACWPDFNDGRFDAVLFTRSLHHIHPLQEAVKCASDCLRDGGRIIVEDFAYESTDENTLRWFTSVSRILDAAGLLNEGNELLDEIVFNGGGLEAWRNNHDHDLNSAAQIGAQLDATMSQVTTKNAPYYFRYLARAVGHLEKRDAIIQAVAEQETALISAKAIISLGRRFIAN